MVIQPANLVFLDPPYHKDLVPQALAALKEYSWLADTSYIVAEVEKTANLNTLPGEIVFDKTYRDTRVVISKT